MRVDVTEPAAKELRDRGVVAFWILPGQLHEDYRGPEWSEEEAVLAPPQRWLLLPTAIESIENAPTEFSQFLHEAGGFRILVASEASDLVLRVHLSEGAIRVHELTDA